MTEGEEIQQEQRRALLRRTQQLLHGIKINLPDCALALCVTSVWRTAMLLMPEDLLREMLREELENSRQRAAICTRCGERRIECEKSHPVICGECEARVETEMKELGREIGDDEP